MAKILLISENEKQNKTIIHALAKSSIAVLCSCDESSVLNYLQNGLVSLILIDEDLKTQDSAILCKKFHAAAMKENISIIALLNQPDDFAFPSGLIL